MNKYDRYELALYCSRFAGFVKIYNVLVHVFHSWCTAMDHCWLNSVKLTCRTPHQEMSALSLFNWRHLVSLVCPYLTLLSLLWHQYFVVFKITVDNVELSAILNVEQR